MSDKDTTTKQQTHQHIYKNTTETNYILCNVEKAKTQFAGKNHYRNGCQSKAHTCHNSRNQE